MSNPEVAAILGARARRASARRARPRARAVDHHDPPPRARVRAPRAACTNPLDVLAAGVRVHLSIYWLYAAEWARLPAARARRRGRDRAARAARARAARRRTSSSARPRRSRACTRFLGLDARTRRGPRS